MKVWITKYALTQGIFEKDARVCLDTDPSGNMIECDPGEYYHGKGKDWHETRECAIAKAEEMKEKKIKSLRAQISKLEKMKFE